MTPPIARLVEAAVHCSACGAQGFLACDCWRQCWCGWLYPGPEAAKRLGVPGECLNPVHRAPPRDVACPHCKVPAGESCRGTGRSERWPEGPPLAYHHARRIRASERAAHPLRR